MFGKLMQNHKQKICNIFTQKQKSVTREQQLDEHGEGMYNTQCQSKHWATVDTSRYHPTLQRRIHIYDQQHRTSRLSLSQQLKQMC